MINVMVPEVAELEELREEMGLSQVDIANQLDVGMSTYQSWIYKDIRPSYESLKKINRFVKKKRNTENIK